GPLPGDEQTGLLDRGGRGQLGEVGSDVGGPAELGDVLEVHPVVPAVVHHDLRPVRAVLEPAGLADGGADVGRRQGAGDIELRARPDPVVEAAARLDADDGGDVTGVRRDVDDLAGQLAGGGAGVRGLLRTGRLGGGRFLRAGGLLRAGLGARLGGGGSGGA